MFRDSRYVYLDHDFVETADGWIFGVVSNTHPPGRVLSYLKYLPGEGLWSRDGVSYRRVLTSYAMREIVQTMETIRRLKPEFIYLDPATGEEFIYVPVDKIAKHHRCEERFREMMRNPENKLEQTCVMLVEKLSSISGVGKEFFGVSGSLLLRLRNPAADIDLVVYGGSNFHKTIQASEEIQTSRDRATTISTLVKNYMSKYPLTQGEAEKLAQRCHTRGIFHGTPYSLHAVKTLAENKKPYGTVVSKPIGIHKTTLKIIDASESIFTPAIYTAEDIKDNVVEKLVCYDTTFAGLLSEGDTVEALGKLEKVEDHEENRIYHSLLVGSVKTAGIEYVKLLEML
ncbi:MAG: hypothetical protein NZ921_03390 [Candidatus Caldarchaeum sp.]|nr:hypothetical protein [Candidatus Caldarchaeum sp.]